MTTETNVCALEACTCHVDEGERYCSDACREAAEANASGAQCRCRHAACVASDYAPPPAQRAAGGR